MFIWEYVNDDIEKLNIISMLTLSKLRQYMGEPSLATEWAKMNGKVAKLNKPIPKYLKVVK